MNTNLATVDDCVDWMGSTSEPELDLNTTTTMPEYLTRLLAGLANVTDTDESSKPVAVATDKQRSAADIPKLVKADKQGVGINVNSGQLHHAVDAAEKFLADSGVVFQRGGQPVTISHDDYDTKQFKPLSTAPLRYELGKMTGFWRDTAQGIKQVDCPEPVARALIDRGYHYLIPVVNGIARHPLVTPDGVLVNRIGYDERTRLYFDFEPSEYSIPENPTLFDARAAADYLLTFLDEFPYDTEADRSAHLAMIIMAAVRVIMRTAPMCNINAPAAGSGKGEASEIVVVVANGNTVSAISWPADKAEQDKLIFSALRAGKSVMYFDNLASGSIFRSDTLCTMMTSPVYSGRILGLSESLDLPTNMLVIINGNNITTAGDLARRQLECRLNPKVEDPSTRKFKRKITPSADALQNRGKIISAILTIIRAYQLAGSPVSYDKPFGSFPDFDKLVRGPLMWLDFPDPCRNTFESMQADPDRNRNATLISLLAKVMGVDTIWTTKQIEARINAKLADRQVSEDDKADARELMTELTRNSDNVFNSHKVSHKLRLVKDLIINKQRIRLTDDKGGSAKWTVEVVS